MNIGKRNSIVGLFNKYNIKTNDNEYIAGRLLLKNPQVELQSIKTATIYEVYLEFLNELIDIRLR